MLNIIYYDVFRTGVNIQDDVHSQMLMDGFWWIRSVVLP